jgi:hypothetical protein
MSSETVSPVRKTAAKKVTTKPPSLGALIDQMHSLREKKRELEASVKDLEGQASEIESQIMDAMSEQGLDKMSGVLATVSITKTTTGNVTDWDELWPYISKNKFFHLVQRRLSDPAYRELLDMGKKVPGVEPFVKARLNLRSR